jgi:hypothetical protein
VSLNEKQRSKLKVIPKMYRNRFIQAYEGSRAAAVAANCLECMGYCRTEVQACDTRTCPMWKVRPYQQSGRRVRITAKKIERQPDLV